MTKKRPKSPFPGRHRSAPASPAHPGAGSSWSARPRPTDPADVLGAFVQTSEDRTIAPELPKTIFKYEPPSLQTIQNIKSQSIYFGSPMNFNDPYDCAIDAVVAEPTEEDFKAIQDYYANTPNAPEYIRNRLISMDPTFFKRFILERFSRLIEEEREKFRRTKGVTCFSDINDDLLMWGHYGACYKGMCLEFRTEYEPFNKIMKVNYAEKMPSIEIRRFTNERNAGQFLASLFCTKSRSWAYEREWRCIHMVAGTSYVYPPEALKAIYFGPNVVREVLEIVCLVLAGQNPDVEIWLGRRSKTEFKVEFVPSDYTPHIVAKRLGLI